MEFVSPLGSVFNIDCLHDPDLLVLSLISLLSFFPFFSGSLCLLAPTVESQHSVLGGVGSGSVSDRSAVARHEASFLRWLSGLSS